AMDAPLRASDLPSPQMRTMLNRLNEWFAPDAPGLTPMQVLHVSGVIYYTLYTTLHSQIRLRKGDFETTGLQGHRPDDLWFALKSAEFFEDKKVPPRVRQE